MNVSFIMELNGVYYTISCQIDTECSAETSMIIKEPDALDLSFVPDESAGKSI